ncbi:hypothetical protein HZ994_04895 [Akkermansiaceae bacterium]|nr:hypothetical protein HZ994_04895 [Akkermansiaceae bacterium]
MRTRNPFQALLLGAAIALAPGIASAKPRQQADAPLTESGETLLQGYEKALGTLTAEITANLPKVDARKEAAFKAAIEATGKAEAAASATQQALAKVNSGKALVDHAKNKWIGGAEKGIAQAQAALKKATTDAEREAAKKDLANWEKNKQEGLAALRERQAAWDKAKADEPKLAKANEAAQAALTKARADELAAATSLLADLAPVLSTGNHDPKLAKCVAMIHATPRGLAAFAQQGAAHAALIDELFANDSLIVEMLVAGGAKFGEYGRAMEIFSQINKASSKAADGNLRRLALATALEHARPINANNPKEATDAPATIDPVNRYLHYEKAFLAGELDPAFKEFTTWEYRHAINCDSPDEILAWGREMLRNYRPDHIYNNDYGWRYVAAVKSEVPYGSQNVQYDEPSLQQHQNIIRNGGVCGRRAFFGRFMLRCFGIPTWGVTQKAHAAVSHWTPKGWVVNLGAGFQHSWWDKDEVSMSGNQFLLDTQARAHGTEEYLKVLRAEWISRILGEQAYNERRKIDGGFWSGMARYQRKLLAATAVTLGPLGQELGEANEREQKVASDTVSAADQDIIVKDGNVTIPAVAHGKSSGKAAAMKSFGGGMQVHFLGGATADYEFELPFSGKYLLTAKVATVQTGQQFTFAVNDSKQPVETPVPYTLGMWQQSEPIELSLDKGKNTLHFQLKQGSRGVTVKEFTLTEVK